MFNVEGFCTGMEFRGSTDKVTKKGDPFTVARFEDSNGYTVEVSARDDAAVASVKKLSKGDICNFPARFVSMREYSFISLLAGLEVVGNAYKD